MRKSRQKGSNDARGRRDAQDQKALRSSVDAAVNEAVKIQDHACNLPAADKMAALTAAETKYREALSRIPVHAEAAYNLATCLSEKSEAEQELRGSSGAKQLALLAEARSLLEGVIERDTSGRGATTALAHHTAGNIIRSISEAQEKQSSTRPGLSVTEHMGMLQRACRHFEEAVGIHERAPNPPGGTDEVLVHWGDALARMMHLVMEGGAGGPESGAQVTKVPPWQAPPAVQVQQALQLCSDASAKYTKALGMDSSSDESDVGALLLKAGAVIDFLDWALPETLQTSSGAAFAFSFQPEPVLSSAEHAVGVLLGLENNHRGGLLAKGDLCRLRARTAMLAGLGLLEEGRWREASVQHLSQAIGTSSPDPETLAAAGEGFLEYGRRSLEIYSQVLANAQAGIVSPVPPGWDPEALRSSALARLQEAAVLLSRSAASDTSDTDSVYNAACAFALAGNEAACRDAVAEYCRRVVGMASSAAHKAAARCAIQDVGSDGDLACVRGTDWFSGLMRDADRALAM